MPPLYPISLLLAGRECLIVGGGSVACRKAADLVACGARVTVVSPELCPEIARLEGVVLIQRTFQEPDAAGKALAFAATSDAAVNRQVADAARRHGAWVNVVDTPAECDFFVPATLHRGDLAISVSTSGASPALARRLREQLEALFPERYADFVVLVGELRSEVIAQVSGPAERHAILSRLAEESTWRLFEASGPEAVRALARQLVAEAL
jgi:precorrin-2 dehydrogenase / sirohydrochlorin ferrochelatase